jgi:predicted CoA-substrate-specific enzyme activase
VLWAPRQRALIEIIWTGADMICAGIDAGSRTVKVVLMEANDLAVVGAGIRDQGVRQAALAQQLLDRVLAESGLERGEVARIVATGCARHSVEADTTVTEITCQARGVCRQFQDAGTVIDIGGQDSKVLCLNGAGGVQDFAMNDRCAAGSGRFLEMVSDRLGVGLGRLGEIAEQSSRPVPISSVCAVFAETEIVGLLAAGTPPADIAAGVQVSIAERVSSMAGRNVKAPIVFTGGVALIPGMSAALSRALGRRLSVAADPQMTAGAGAAIIACQGSADGVGGRHA